MDFLGIFASLEVLLLDALDSALRLLGRFSSLRDLCFEELEIVEELVRTSGTLKDFFDGGAPLDKRAIGSCPELEEAFGIVLEEIALGVVGVGRGFCRRRTTFGAEDMLESTVEEDVEGLVVGCD